MFAGMNKRIFAKIEKLVNLGFGNIEIKRQLENENIKLGNSTIYRYALKLKDKFYRSRIIDFDYLEDTIIIPAKITKQKERGIFIEFALQPLKNILLKQDKKVIPYFSKDFSKMLIVPQHKSKIKLSPKKSSPAIMLSFSRFVEDNEKFPDKIDLYIPLKKFGIADFQTI